MELIEPVVKSVTNVVSQEKTMTGLGKRFGGSTAVYSLRDVGAGGGRVVNIRRDSDDTTQDFTAAQLLAGDADTFVGASNNGFVAIWYDQNSEANNLTAASANQPLIVSSGTLVTDNGKPAMDFNGSDQFLNFTKQLRFNTTTTDSAYDLANMVFSVCNITAGNRSFIGTRGSNHTWFGVPYNGNFIFRDDASGSNDNIYNTGVAVTLDTQQLLTFDNTASNTIKGYKDGSLIYTVDNAAIDQYFRFEEFAAGYSTNENDMKVQELVFFPYTSTNRSLIEDNMLAYHGI